MSDNTKNKTRERSADEQRTISEVQKLIDEMIIAQDNSDNGHGQPLSDVKFAPQLGFKGAKWGLMKSGDYFDMVENVSKLLHDFRRQVNNFKNTKLVNERFGDKPFIPLDPFKSIFSAVEECSKKPLSDIKRFIVYLGPTGSGKTFLGGQLARLFAARCVDSNKSWRNSDFFALKAICAKFELEIPKGFPADHLRTALVEEFRLSNPVLFIDEAEFFGADVINLLKALINDTCCVIVIGALPEAYAKWNQYWKMEADQLRRRTHLVVRHNPITPDIAAKFLAPLALGEHAERASELLSDAANVFGAYDIMASVVERLKRLTNITPAKITNSIAIEYEKMGFEAAPKKGSK